MYTVLRLVWTADHVHCVTFGLDSWSCTLCYVWFGL